MVGGGCVCHGCPGDEGDKGGTPMALLVFDAELKPNDRFIPIALVLTHVPTAFALVLRPRVR